MTAGLAVVMLFHVSGWVDAAMMPGSDEEARGTALLEWLDDRDLRACYSASPLYHLVFRGGEKVVMAPLQKDRYPAYNAVIEEAESICYVFREDQQQKRQHLAMLDLLRGRGVRYRQSEVGPYRVLHDFEPRRSVTAADVEEVRRASPREGKAKAGEAAERPME